MKALSNASECGERKHAALAHIYPITTAKTRASMANTMIFKCRDNQETMKILSYLYHFLGNSL